MLLSSLVQLRLFSHLHLHLHLGLLFSGLCQGVAMQLPNDSEWLLGDFLLAQDEPIPYYLQYSGYVSIFQHFVTVFTTHFFTTTQFNVCSIIGR